MCFISSILKSMPLKPLTRMSNHISFSYKERDEKQTSKIKQICKRQQKRMSCKFLQNRQLITSVSTTYTRQQD